MSVERAAARGRHGKTALTVGRRLAAPGGGLLGLPGGDGRRDLSPTHRHASEAFTASVYQHALPGLDREAAGTIAALFVDLVAETDTGTDCDAESTTPDEARCGSVSAGTQNGQPDDL